MQQATRSSGCRRCAHFVGGRPHHLNQPQTHRPELSTSEHSVYFPNRSSVEWRSCHQVSMRLNASNKHHLKKSTGQGTGCDPPKRHGDSSTQPVGGDRHADGQAGQTGQTGHACRGAFLRGFGRETSIWLPNGPNLKEKGPDSVQPQKVENKHILANVLPPFSPG